MLNTWENVICKEHALKYAKYAKYVNKNAICRICTPHFVDAAQEALDVARAACSRHRCATRAR